MINLDTYLNQTVAIIVKSGLDNYGKAVEGVTSEIRARYVEKISRVHDVKGEELNADASVWLDPDVEVTINDHLLFEGVKHKIVRVDTKRWFDGNAHHKKAYVVRIP